MDQLAEQIDGLPNISGSESRVEAAIAAGRRQPVFHTQRSRFDGVASAFAVALHMHQPLIPAGGPELRTARVISNLQYMLEHQGVGDNHNAPVFLRCYQRMGEIVPRLADEGRQPRVMLEYSGTLLHGLRQIGASEVIDALRRITCDPRYSGAVEWLGCSWGHAVAPPPRSRTTACMSGPGNTTSRRCSDWPRWAVCGVSRRRRWRCRTIPTWRTRSLRTLLDCGYEWVLVQEHTVERLDGGGVDRPHVPHRLVCTSSTGETASIVAVVKTQGSDTKLVGQMQPYYEAKGLSRQDLAGHSVPPLVTQIADGENGEVMMNEFPAKYEEVVRECSGTATSMMNVTEYLEQLHGTGVDVEDLPVIQPLLQHRIWERMSPGTGPTGSPPSPPSWPVRTAASTWKAAAGRATSPGFGDTTTC